MKKTGKNIIILFAATLIAKFIGVFKSFFLAKILEPADYGIWITILLIVSYSPIISLGIGEALLKEVPYFKGKKDDAAVKRVENCVLGFILLLSIILLIITFTFHFFITNEKTINLIPYIRLMLLSLVLNTFYAFFYHRFAAYHNFKMVGTLDTLKSILIFVFQIPLAYFYGLLGVVIGQFLCMLFLLITAMTTSIKLIGKAFFLFDFKLIKNLIKVGLPITLVMWLFVVQSSVDRIVSMSLLGKEATGFYGLGIAIVSVFILIPKAVGRVMYPKINEKYGESQNKLALASLVEKPTSYLSMLTPVFIIVILSGLPIVFNVFLQKYSPGLLSAQILILGAFFTGLTRNGINFLIAINKKRIVIIFLGICISTNIIGNIILVNLGYNINGIAVSTSFSTFLLTTIVWLAVFKNLEKSFLTAIKKIFWYYLPFIILLICFLISYIFFPNLLMTATFFLPLHFFIIFCVMMIIFLLIPGYNKAIREMIKNFKIQRKK